ncbi:HECTc [Musa troglodytarum]|uniref:HECT-type E3 ubiquitin transferase n=1 Tax=Musa troglodytarum TaxID=320322 RepID=A0A9E7FU94_9LILI|nr:HECTc [Musa troglodytarum]
MKGPLCNLIDLKSSPSPQLTRCFRHRRDSLLGHFLLSFSSSSSSSLFPRRTPRISISRSLLQAQAAPTLGVISRRFATVPRLIHSPRCNSIRSSHSWNAYRGGMFFMGDASTRKRVDLGGRSSKESDRQVLLEQARLDRKRRLVHRQQTSAAIKIQKCFRGMKDVKMARTEVREQFHATYGDHGEKADWHCFGPDSEFLRQLLFFFTANNTSDVALLVKACRLLLQHLQQSGNIVTLFAGLDYPQKNSLVDLRVKKLAYACLQAIFHNRNHYKNKLLMPSTCSHWPTVALFETVACLTNPELPWNCSVIDYLMERKVFLLLRCIILAGVQDVKSPELRVSASALEHVLIILVSHVGQQPCHCSNADPRWNFSLQILSIPFLWHHLPFFKEVILQSALGRMISIGSSSFVVFWSKGLGRHYIHQMANVLPSHAGVLPDYIVQEYPGYACLLGNLLEVAGVVFSDPSSTYHTEYSEPVDDELTMDDEVLSPDLQKQISSSIDSRLLQHLVNALLKATYPTGYSDKAWPSNVEVEAISAVCTFLHVTFCTLPHELIMTLLAYRTELLPTLWNYIKRCHENQRWPFYSTLTAHIPGDTPGWLLPLAVFCPLYKHMLKFVDTEEFYEQETPVKIEDIPSLVIIIKQALWQLLWTIHGHVSTQKPSRSVPDDKKLSVELINRKARVAMSELLSQLQDWNNRRQFMSADDFHLQEARSETFVSQASLGNTRASDILKQAPFLVPFTSRVEIFTSELVASRQRSGAHPALVRCRFRIRRNRILEDAFNQLHALSEDDLRGPIRISFVNEFGVEEAGIDGGGIFKDFMENIIQAAFDVQYGLFKETPDHLLYPNPGSALVHEQHLQFFHFLGTLLGKPPGWNLHHQGTGGGCRLQWAKPLMPWLAMYEGILVDIPFATFFLSKLKEKSNFLHDLPSLDPELYRHLLFLKHYKGDVSELELYFVAVNNEYGEQTEEELIPGGKNLRVTKDNVISFIHLVANYRLNFQIRIQSLHFLRGFQQLIQKEWIEMFNEHEIQLLISGSLESMNVDDLRSNTRYTGGYHHEHQVIEMFWEVLKSFSLEYQKKFLKFVTGCSRGPLLGFKYLEPKFCILRAAPLDVAEEDLDRLPTSATCMNLLKLPPYQSKAQMQTKLIYAISADAGFDLS